MGVLESDSREQRAETDGPLHLDQLQDGLASRYLGTRLHYLSEIDSTNAYAKLLAVQGAGEGEVVVAETQTRGRGRLGRRWVSPAFLNLYFSVILRPRFAPVQAPQITLMAAVALADTVTAFLGRSPTIKWPNDILVGGKKLAGILTESSCNSEGIEFVILGVGVNLNYPVALMPEGIRERATSMIALTQRPISREAFARRLIQDLDRCYGELQEEGFSSLALRWEALFGLRGKRVGAQATDQSVIGRARGLDRDGALLVEDDEGIRHRIVAGDVVLLEE
jgi:BirA family biotin operon repressor/biotin-[acetyl-CoA-carboxylase] ligase